MYHLRVPVTEQELKEYYQFRWEMLRKPLHQPVGSEKDAYDAMAHHQMVVDEAGKIVAIGRLYINADNEAAIRFLAVDPTLQDKGLGTLVAITLESVARQEGVKRVVCSAREDAVDFFAKLGFVNQGEITAPQTTASSPVSRWSAARPPSILGWWHPTSTTSLRAPPASSRRTTWTIAAASRCSRPISGR